MGEALRRAKTAEEVEVPARNGGCLPGTAHATADQQAGTPQPTLLPLRVMLMNGMRRSFSLG